MGGGKNKRNKRHQNRKNKNTSTVSYSLSDWHAWKSELSSSSETNWPLMILFSGKITQKYTAEDRENVLRFQRFVYTCVQFEKFNIFSHSDFYVKSIQWN